ncbi:MAG: hypothetical protein IKN36_03440, partial [Clostridia bacterium]|nr:hypothetical protein [Clostridia bacterium]
MRNRKKKNGGNRLENLSALILNDSDISPETGSLFDKDRPLRLEIGCGKGDFISGVSLREPDYNYIAWNGSVTSRSPRWRSMPKEEVSALSIITADGAARTGLYTKVNVGR